MPGGIKTTDRVDPNKHVEVQKPPAVPPPGPGRFDAEGLEKTEGAKKPIEDIGTAGRRRLAEEAINKEWRKRGGPNEIGQLGKPLDEVLDNGDGTFTRRFEFGALRTMGGQMDEVLLDEGTICDIDVAAIWCFGTDDPGGSDEPYLIITAVSPAGAFDDRGNIVKTWKSQTFEGVEPGVFATDLPAFRDLPVGPRGISLKLVLMEHEHGDEEDLRKKIEEKGKKLADEIMDAAALLGGLNVDDQMKKQAMDSEILSTLGDISVDLLVGFLKDDKIDEKTWQLPGALLKQWADDPEAYKNSAVDHENMPAHVKTNFPREGIHDMHWLFSGGGGSYKVFLRVTPKNYLIGPKK
jgi:hypothetical protein